MQCTAFLWIVLFSAGIARGDDPAPATDSQPTDSQPADWQAVDAALDRGLAFLAADALAWKRDHNCVSCHHAGLVVWAMHEAKRIGRGVDEAVLSEMTKWLTESGDGKVGLERPASAPRAYNSKALYFTLSLGAIPHPDEASRAAIGLMLKTVQGDQIENGSWSAWPETRPPFFGGSDETTTALALLALLPAATAGDESARSVRDKGVQWLIKTPTDDDPQSIAMRLTLWARMGRPAAEIEPLVRRVKERQNPDGGWSQAAEMASDAWATGQALYALSHAGIEFGDDSLVRARAFLVGSQREDGSWPMTSRPTKPGGDGSTSLIPITGGGSAWGIIGLARSRPAPIASDKAKTE